MKKIVIAGPECTGKSTLAEQLAKHYQTSWVPEYAREYLENLNQKYEPQDLVSIAKGQLRLEKVCATEANQLLICDTDLLVIKIWSEFKYGMCDRFILEHLKNNPCDFYLLPYIDVPWEKDPQREHPNKREELYQIYWREIKSMDIPFAEIRGPQEERKKMAIEAINKILATA